MNKENAINCIEKNKIIAVIREVEKEQIIPLAYALYNGGIRLVEIAFIQGEDNDKTYQLIEMLKKEFGDKMCIGGGTVLDKEQVVLTKKAGGNFIVSPDTFKEVIDKTLELEMVSIPGAFTPSEIQNAYRLKADFVKVFPASTLKADYIKAIKVPYSKIKMLAFGGIGVKDIKAYLTAGVSGFGISSKIVDKNKLLKNEYSSITKMAKKYVDAIM